MQIKLVKCKKCGTTVMTNTTLHDRLLGEKNMVMSEIQKLTEKEKGVFGNALKRLKAEKVAQFGKLGELNQLLKQLRHQVRESERDVHEVFSELLCRELKILGFSSDQLRQIGKQAENIHKDRTAKAQKELERIYGSLN